MGSLTGNMAQNQDEILVKTNDNEFILKGRPCELSAFSYVPPSRNDPKERTFYNSDQKEHYSSSNYDRMFHYENDFNNKLHRCDREHAKSRGLTVNQEESQKDVPTLASSVYGHRLPSDLDPPDRKNVRIAHVQTEFFRRNGINVKPQE